MKKVFVNRNYILLIVFFISSFDAVLLFGQTVPDTIFKKDTLKNFSSASQSPLVKDTTQKAINSLAKNTTPSSGGHSAISLEFIKEKSEYNPDSTYFNIIKITNNNGSAVQGVIRISVPGNWKALLSEDEIVTILPGKTEYFPFRILISHNAVGGVTYLVNATLISNRSLFSDKNQTSVSKACYITIPKKSKWSMAPLQRNIYIDRFANYAPLQVKLTNKGNGNEVVKLELALGSSLFIPGQLGNIYFTSIEVPAGHDTILSYPVKYVPADESTIWDRDFRKMNVKITATVDSTIEYASVNFKYLESSFHNTLAENVTPLTLEMQLMNLMSDVMPRLMVGASGYIMLKNDDNIDYYARFANIPFVANTSELNYGRFIWRTSRMRARYMSKLWDLSVGDINSSNSGMLGIFGRGVGGNYKINSSNSVGGAITVGIASPMYSGNIHHSVSLRNGISLTSSLDAIIDNYNKINTYGAGVQSGFTFLNNHYVTLFVGGSMSQHNYSNQTFTDGNGNYILTNDPGKTYYGLASRLSYQTHYKKLSGSLTAGYISQNYSQYNNGRIDASASANYLINNKYAVFGSSNFTQYDPHIYNLGVLSPYNKYSTGRHGVELTDHLTGKLILFAGPFVEHISTFGEKLFTTTGNLTNTHFASVTPLLSLRLSYKNQISGFVNPYVLLGYTFITAAQDSTVIIPPGLVSKKEYFNARAGLNVIQNNWGVNVFYYYGPSSSASQNDFYYYGVYSKSLRIMPYFQKYFYHKTMLLSSYDSYYFEVASNNEHFALNARLSFFLQHLWTLFVDNNLFMSSTVTTDNTKAFSRSYYLNVGFKKSFDIPQPKVKYYNLRVICFKDINGNGVMDGNEHGLQDIVISIDRGNRMDSVSGKPMKQPGHFMPCEMVTDNFGSVIYYHIPEGEFNVNVFPLVNLKDLYNIKGQKQKAIVSRDTTYYIPFVQSNRVEGRVIINRDEFSSLGAISTANIRITATDSLGNSFPTLTAADGSYVLYVPTAGEYNVSINKVFDDQFSLQEGEYKVRFNGLKEFHIDFIFNEVKRKVNINGKETSVDTLLNRNKPLTAEDIVGHKPSNLLIAGKDTLKDVKMVMDTLKAVPSSDGKTTGAQDKPKQYLLPVGPNITYKVQLVSTSTRIPKAQYGAKFPGAKNVKEYAEDGMYKYTVGDLKTIDEAKKLKDDIRAKGYKDAFLVPFHKGIRIRY